MNAKETVQKMTLEEKASMVSGSDFWHLDAIDRLGIKETMVSDGPHGLRKQVDSAGADINESIVAVCFPSAAGTASSFNRNLLSKLGETLGEECSAENVSVLLGPAVNIKRSPLCGRNFEYFSEDPYLAGELASSYINGVQSKGVGTSIKHFAVNSQEKRRMTISSVLDERTFREIYLSAFEKAVKKSQPWTVMCSYNKINGVYSSENPYLLTKILRDEWGFKGYVMSDWGACNDRVKGIKAGLDLEMPSSAGINTKKIIEAVKNKTLDEKDLDTCCERILEKVLEYQQNRKYTKFFDRDEHHKIAQKIAEESMVLLKNDNNILPLKKGQKVAFIGEFARFPRYQGGGSSHIRSHKVDSALDTVKARGGVNYAKGFPCNRDLYEPEKAKEAIELARLSDVAVVFAGLPESMESEGFDRQHINLPDCQNRLIEEICAVQKNVVVVLHNGSPVAMPWIDKVSAVLESYLAGEGVGHAQIGILYGDVNPSGKLAETFPLALSDTPCYRNFPGNELTVEYREGIYVGYRYYDTVGKDVLFPFGHGLSYTTFEYSNIKANKRKIDENGSVKISLTVKNTGNVAGAETVQVYVGKEQSNVFRAEKELKGFEKVFLQPNEEKEIEIELDSRAFSYYNTEIYDWYAESGKYQICIGSSSRDIKKVLNLTLENSKEINSPYDESKFRSYYSAEISNVSDEEFSRLLGFPIPEPNAPKGKKIGLENSFIDAENTKWGSIINKTIRFGASLSGDNSLGNNEMIVSSTLECPLHSAMAMSQGMLDEDMAKSLVNIMNGDKVVKSAFGLAKGGIKKVSGIVISRLKNKMK